MGSEMRIEIPKNLIEDTIRAELVRQLSEKDKERWLEEIVRHAMSQKSDQYRNETYFQEAINKMIRDEATNIFKEWIDENRANIKAALLKYLNANKQKQLTEFAEKLSKNIMRYGIGVQLNLRDVD